MTTTTKENLQKAFADVTKNYSGITENPYELYRKMRQESPVLDQDIMAAMGVPSIAGRDPERKTFSVFKYNDCMNVLKDAKTYTSGFIAEGLGSFLDGLILTGMDGEAHKNARNLLTPVFSASTINRWKEGRIEKIIRSEFVNPIVSTGKANLADMALNFPIRIIYSLIGFPEDRPELIEQFAAWALTILSGPQLDPEKAKQAQKAAFEASDALYQAIRPIVKQRREGTTDGDDLISHLIRAEYKGKHLNDHEITTFVRSLLPAAGETTTRTFGTVMTLLLERPSLLKRIRKDRSLVPKAINEAIRFEPVSTFKVRQASSDTEIRGVKIPKGSMVSCIVASANRDEEVFDDADQFNIDRPRKPSFGFGFGPHMCIGMFVALAELESALNAVLDGMPNIRLDTDMPPPVISGLQLRGPKDIHVVWDTENT